MFKIFMVFLSLLLVVSCSSNKERYPAQTLEPGEYQVNADWERVERGIKTGDFSCKGTCAEVSIDWNRIGKKLSGQNSREMKKLSVNYCINQYVSHRQIQANLEKMLGSGQISNADFESIMGDERSILTIVDRACTRDLGKKEAMNLKKEILGN